MGKSKYENQFQEDMEESLVKFKVGRQYLPSRSKKDWLYSDISDNLFPPIRHGFMQYVYDNAMPLHDYINHVRSSQAYCVNIFFYLIQNHKKKLINYFNDKLSLKIDELENFEFEYSPEENVLGEWKSDKNRPEEYVTAVDLLMLGMSSKGQKQAILIEVKFTESGFSECGGFNSGANAKETREACNKGNLLLQDYKNCYLHGCKDKSKLRRKYFDLVIPGEAYESAAFNDKCPFIETHQCLRNHSLMKSFEKEKYEARLCLVHHQDNATIVEKWNQYVNILKPDQKSKLCAIPGKEIVEYVGDSVLKKYFEDRYTIKSHE